MNIEHLKTFVSVYRAKGFASVAKEQGVVPSSVSRAIAALEAQLTVRLFHRTTRRLTPTEAGETFFRRISLLMEEFDAACAVLADQSSRPSGRLRVTASVSYGQIVIVPKLKAFRLSYPDIDLELVLSDRCLDLVGERFDMAIRHGVLRDSSLVARKIRDVRYYVVASPEYLAHARRIRTPLDIAYHPTVTFSLDGFRMSWCFRKREKKTKETVVSLAPALVVSNAIAIRQVVREGVGLALLADWTIAEDLRNGSLVKVLPKWEVAGSSFDSAVWLVSPSRAYVPEKVRVFSELLQDRCETN